MNFGSIAAALRQNWIRLLMNILTAVLAADPTIQEFPAIRA
jgi:hypothetical protein